MTEKKTYLFSQSQTDLYLDVHLGDIDQLLALKRRIYITNRTLYELYPDFFKSAETIVVADGERYKTFSTVAFIVKKLLQLKANRTTTLIGVGGGVITDITGFVASIYMRGLSFGFVPTSLLALVDASMGGKNGIDIGLYKNSVGIVRQPRFIIHDYRFLETLPLSEWINGFAEIIKHSCIKNADLFELLERSTIAHFQNTPQALSVLIAQNVAIKMNVVQADEYETGERKLLNFGHTLGHAIENKYKLPHGQAVSLGMVAAGAVSAHINGFNETPRMVQLLKKYQLQTELNYNLQKIKTLMVADKKMSDSTLHYIVLKQIGEAAIEKITIPDLLRKIPQPPL